MGIGFAIPVNLVKEELPQLRDQARSVRGWLGVYMQQVTPAIAESMGLEEPRGALVAEVLDDSPAKNGGAATRRRNRGLQRNPDRRLAGTAVDGRRTPLGHRRRSG